MNRKIWAVQNMYVIYNMKKKESDLIFFLILRPFVLDL